MVPIGADVPDGAYRVSFFFFKREREPKQARQGQREKES